MKTFATNFLSRCKASGMFVIGIVGLSLLLAAPDASAQFCSTPSFSFGTSSHSINYCGVLYNFPDNGESTWFYCINGEAGKGVNTISHHIVELPACLQESFVDAGKWAEDDSNPSGLPSDGSALMTTSTTLGVDGSTGIDGLKFNDSFEEGVAHTKYRYITFNQNFIETTWDWTVKAGNADHTATVPGPVGTCTDLDLPVELGSFDAVLDDGEVILTWTTLSETDNAGFSIERSENGNPWTEVAFVDGAGTTLEPVSYSHRVSDVAPGVNRFRLKQIDFDGAFVYSALVEVTVELPGTHLLSEVYPNPFNPRSSFSLVVSREQGIEINMYDALGRHVRTLFNGTVEANAARTFLVDSEGLTSGTYIISVSGETFRDSRNVTLLK